MSATSFSKPEDSKKSVGIYHSSNASKIKKIEHSSCSSLKLNAKRQLVSPDIGAHRLDGALLTTPFNLALVNCSGCHAFFTRCYSNIVKKLVLCVQSTGLLVIVVLEKCECYFLSMDFLKSLNVIASYLQLHASF